MVGGVSSVGLALQKRVYHCPRAESIDSVVGSSFQASWFGGVGVAPACIVPSVFAAGRCSLLEAGLKEDRPRSNGEGKSRSVIDGGDSGTFQD